MGVPIFYYKHTPFGGSATTYYDFTSIRVQRSMQAESSLIEIEIPNRFGKFSGLSSNPNPGIGEEDTIAVYGSWETIVEGTDLIINSTVKEFGAITKEEKRVLTIKGMDRTYQLLSKIYTPGKFDRSESKDAPSAIIDIVNWVSTLEGYDNPTITTTNVKTSAWSGAAYDGTFDTIGVALVMKTAYEWLQELSQDPYTRYNSGTKSDRAYTFWIDTSNDLHWEYPVQSGGTTMEVGQATYNIFECNMNRSVFDVVNMVIYDAGEDISGTSIWWYFYDPTSTQPEIRIKFQPMTDIARDLKEREKNFMDENSLTYDSDGYPDNYADYQTAGGPTWTYNYADGGKPDTDAEYLGSIRTGDGFRGACRAIADGRSKAIIKGTSSLRWKGTVTMRGSTTFNPGDLIELTWADYDMVNELLRVKQVTQQYDVGGWQTILDLEEDEPPVTF